MQPTPHTRRSAVRTAVVLIASSMTAPALAQTKASWVNPVDGQWIDKIYWSTNPDPYPRNTTSQSYQVVVDAVGTPYTVTLGNWGGNVGDLTVDSLTLNSTDATLAVAGGTLRALTPIQIGAGRLLISSDFPSALGTISGTIAPGGTGTFDAYRGGLDSVILQRRLNVLDTAFSDGLIVTNGLTLGGGTVALRQTRSATRSRLLFAGTQTLAGNGDVLFEAGGPFDAVVAVTAGSLTTAPAVTIRSAGGDGTISLTSGRLINNGTIRAEGANRQLLITAADSGTNGLVNQSLIESTAGATLSISGQFSNAGGTIRANGGTVFVGDAHVGAPSYITADLGTLRALNGGQIVLGGYLNNTGSTLTASDTTGDLTLGTVTVTGGTVATSGAVSFRSYSGINATLDNVTLAGRFTGAATIRNGLTLDNATVALDGPGLWGTDSPAIVGTGQVRFGGPTSSTIKHNGVGTITVGPGITILTAGASGVVGENAPGRSVISDATLLSQNAGHSLTVANFTNNGQILVANGGSVTTSGDFTNNGTISVTNSGVLTLRDNWSSSVGTITMSDAQVNFGGTFSPGALAHFSRSSGAVYLDGTLDVTGSTFPLNATTGSWKLAGGSKILNGVVNASDGQFLTVVGNAELSGVTLASPVLVNYAKLTLSNNTTLSAGCSITLAPVDLSQQMILQVNSSTLAGTGEVVFDNATSAGINRLLGPAAGLTLAPGITVRTGTGGGNVGETSTPLTNQGTLSARTPGTGLGAFASNLINTGTAEATNGATLNLFAAGTLTNTGTVAATAGGTVNLAASWTNSGLISADSATVNLGGTFTPASIGTVSVSNNGALNVTGYLDATSTPLTLSAALPLALSGGTITGTINSADNTPLLARSGVSRLSSAALNAPVTVLSGATLNAVAAALNRAVTVNGGGTLSLSGTWANNASITATPNSTVSLSSTPPTSVGVISLTDSTLRITGSTLYTTALLRPVSFTNSQISVGLNAVLDNTGDTLSLSPATATLALGPGGVKGGTIAGPANVPVVFTSGATSSTLNGVTLAADTNVVPSSSLSFSNGLTLDHARVSLTPGPIGPTGRSASLIASGTQTLGGTGTITYDGVNDATSSAVVRPSSGTLTIGPDVTVRTGTNSGFIGLSPTLLPLILNGTVSAETAGTKITVFGSTVTNNGVMRAINGATLALTGPSFTNTGTVTVDALSTLLMANGSAPGGTINLSGNAIVNYTGNSPVDAVRQQLAIGRDGITGIVRPEAAGDPTRAVAYVEASLLLGLTGSQTATWSGQVVDATSLLLFPARFGDANFDGKVDGDDYALLDRGLAKGLAGWVNGDFNYDGAVTTADYLLIDATLAAQAPFSPEFLAQRESRFGADYVAQLLATVPEPSSPACVVGVATALASRGRRRGRGGPAAVSE